LNYEESNDDIRETAAILDAIFNFSKCSRVTKVHPADSENRPPGLPKTIKKKLTLTFPGSAKICHLAPGLKQTKMSILYRDTSADQVSL